MVSGDHKPPSPPNWRGGAASIANCMAIRINQWCNDNQTIDRMDIHIPLRQDMLFSLLLLVASIPQPHSDAGTAARPQTIDSSPQCGGAWNEDGPRAMKGILLGRKRRKMILSPLDRGVVIGARTFCIVLASSE